MKQVKNILLDFGGVLYEIDPVSGNKALSKLGVLPGAWISKNESLLNDLECGKLSFKELYEKQQNKPVYSSFRKAFNRILVGIYPETIQTLNLLSSHYKLYLLSNTNHEHYDYFSKQMLANKHAAAFYTYFEKCYFSFEMGCRKPGIQIFEKVISDAGLIPAETLFVDDSIENCDTALKMGFKTFHFTNQDMRKDLFCLLDIDI